MRRLLVLFLLCAGLDAAIKRVSLVHLSHTDVGFTDHPAVTRELQKEYIDLALDAALARRDFRWTTESMLSVDDWWKAVTPQRRAQFLEAVRRGQIAVAALPFNNTPFLDHAEWRQMVHWIPEDLWTRLRPTVAVQDDVNGFPRAGALALLDRGVHRLMMGLNSDQGGSPLPRPTAFWWKMPDGRRMMVYIGDSYPAGYSYFHTADWRRGPVPAAADTVFRRPHAGDFFRTDDASLQQAHAILLRRLKDVEEHRGYRWETLVVPFSNQWRMDNDPPFPAIAEFVAAWNRKGLKPELELTTAAAALASFEKEYGAGLSEYEGEWTDWWANGTASAPREVAASRAAKRYLEQFESPVFSGADKAATALAEQMRKEVCLFDEHTWGSSLSVARPDALDSQAQFNEKARLAYRPWAMARYLAGDQARARVASMPEGMYVINPAPLAYTGWINVPLLAFRQAKPPKPDHVSAGIEPWEWPTAESDVSMENDARLFRDARPVAGRFWVSNLAPGSVTTLAGNGPALSLPAPEIETGADGWPAAIRWAGANATTLRTTGLGDFFSIAPKGQFPRVVLRDMSQRKPGEVAELPATSGAAVREETPRTVTFRQPFTHPSLKRGLRVMEIWKELPRVQIRFSIYRLSSEAPESFYASFPMPVDSAAVTTTVSSGGTPYVPYTGQLPGACRDYFAIDGWVHYASTRQNGDWLWVSRDAPLITFDKVDLWVRREQPRPTDRILVNLFNNLWYTNFVANESGVFEYQFDIQWAPRIPDPAALARTLLTDPWAVTR
jgi:hypothetical protein